MLLGNRSVLLKSPGRFLAGTIASSERSNFTRHGEYRSADYPALASLPAGYGATGLLPARKAGDVSSVNAAAGTSSAATALAAGRNIDGTAAGTSDAQGTGQTVASISATAAGEAAVTGNVFASLSGVGSAAGVGGASGTITAKGWITAQAGGAGSCSMTRYALGHLSGTTEEAGLSVAGITNSVVEALNAERIPVNVAEINGTEVAGTGTDGDPWR